MAPDATELVPWQGFFALLLAMDLVGGVPPGLAFGVA
jgi:hypothetical protein